MTDVRPAATRAGAGPGAGTGVSRADSLAVPLLVLLTVLLVVPLGRVVWSHPGAADDFNQRVSWSPFDIPLALLLALWITRVGPPRSWRRPRGAALLAALGGVVLAVAFAVHPSPRGVDLGLRLLAGTAVVHALTRAPRGEARQVVLGAIVAVGAFEAVLGMAQSAHGGPLGIRALEFSGRLYPFGDSFAGRGGLDHPYHLTCLLLLAVAAALAGGRGAARRWPWAAGIAVCAMGIAVTYSRASLLALVPIVLICVVAGRRDRNLRIAAVAVVAGFALGATLFGNGWISRSNTTLEASAADSGRSDRAREALRLIRSDPVFGVGPGRYVIALHGVDHKELLPAHDLALQEAAEGGVLAGILAAAALAAFGLRALRRGPVSVCCYLALVPFFVLDSYPYVFGTGLVVTALWVGVVEVADA